MFLSSLTSSDTRFKTLHFREGLNILVADRTEVSEQGDSRNSIGKTSFVKVLKYVLGGDLAPEFKVPELSEHTFTVTVALPSADDSTLDEVTITRAVSPTTRVEFQAGPPPTAPLICMWMNGVSCLVARFSYSGGCRSSDSGTTLGPAHPNVLRESNQRPSVRGGLGVRGQTRIHAWPLP